MKTRELSVELVKQGQPNDTVFVLGATGCGKTTLIANLAKERTSFVIVDTKNDFPSSFFPSATIVKSEDEFRSALNSGKHKIIVQLWEQPDMEHFFDKVCASLYQFHVLNQENKLSVTFVVDECNNFVYVNHCPKSFQDITQRGRSVGIRKIYGAQWFGTIPTWMRDTFTEIYTFNHTDETGVERLTQFGFDPDEVKDLPQYVCLYRGKNGLERISLVPSKSARQTT